MLIPLFLVEYNAQILKLKKKKEANSRDWKENEALNIPFNAEVFLLAKLILINCIQLWLQVTILNTNIFHGYMVSSILIQY